MTPRDYVKGAMHSRQGDIATLMDREAEGDDDARTELDELPLSIEIERHIIITLSTGGPHEELDVRLDSGGDVAGVTFGAYWGSERRETEIHHGQELWMYAERIAEYEAETA